MFQYEGIMLQFICSNKLNMAAVNIKQILGPAIWHAQSYVVTICITRLWFVQHTHTFSPFIFP